MRYLITLLTACQVFILALTSTQLYAVEARTAHVKSPAHRVAMLELYTSQGCSSCPPAEKWLSAMQEAGVAKDQLIPLAFHVTYWDYIGWKDNFASPRHDERQRKIAQHNEQKTVYTPQLVLSGDDYRNHNRFFEDVAAHVMKPSSVDLELTATADAVTDAISTDVKIEVRTDVSRSRLKDITIYLAVYENNLQSTVDGGENDGEELHHDYVVRQLYGPFIQSAPQKRGRVDQTLVIEPDWKLKDVHLVAFAQNPNDGEVLQAVSLSLENF